MHDADEGALGHVEVTRVSTASDGSQLSAKSVMPSLSADGSKVAFQLIPLDPVTGFVSGPPQIYVKDLVSGILTLASSSATGEAANVLASAPAISADGTKVVFWSNASNLVDSDTNNHADVFVKDLLTGSITRISTDASGNQMLDGDSREAAISNDGTLVVFRSNSNSLVAGDTNSSSVYDLFVKNLVTGEIQLVSANSAGVSGDGSSSSPSFSPDGKSVVFQSFSGNLVEGTSGIQVFIKNLQTGEITLTSRNTAGEMADGLSAGAHFSPDGSKIVFESYATNLVSGDTNGAPDIFVQDLATGAVTRVSLNASGEQLDGGAQNSNFAGNDRVIFTSEATNLLPGDENNVGLIFVKDLLTGHVTRLVANLLGEEGNNILATPAATWPYAVSLDGTHAAFPVASDNFVFGDTNGSQDIYLTNRGLVPDVLLGTPFDETITGTSANEVFVGYFGADSFVGGGGNDTVSYIDDGAPVFVNLTLGQGFTNTSYGDTYSGIANVIGSSAGDFIIGNEGPNKLDGRAGDDVLVGGFGGDWLIGGAGNDWASYEENSGTVFVNLTLGRGYNNGAEGDTLEGIENLVGGLFDDFFIGDENANRLNGAMGADTLVGAGGADVFMFTYAPGATSAYGSPNVDLIVDFHSGEDIIELSASAFPGLAVGALPAGAFYAGTAAHDADDRIIYDSATGKLWFDPDGAGGQAAVLFATLGDSSHPATLAATDFAVA